MTNLPFKKMRQSAVDSSPAIPQLFRAAFTLPLLLAILGVLVFHGVARNGFVNLDDPVYLTANPHVLNGLTLDGVAWAFTTGHGGNWHPLTWLSLMLDVQLWGLNPTGTHLFSVTLHIANSVLLFCLLRSMTGAAFRSALAAVLFEVHPLHVESVAWAAERKDVLSGLFFMLTLTAYWKSCGTEKAPTWRILTPVFFILGLLAKPMLVTIPLVLMLLDFWRKPFSEPMNGQAKNSGDSFRRGISTAWLRLGQALRQKAWLFALSILFCLITLLAQKNGRAVQGFASCPPATRIENALVSVCRYLRRAILPYGLATPYEDAHAWPLWMTLAAGALLAVLSWRALQTRRVHPHIFVGWYWFLIMLVPVIGLVQVGAQSIADRYTYLPLIGIFIVFSWEASRVVEFLRIPTALKAAFAVALVTACGWGSVAQTTYWRDSESLLKRAIAVTGPNWIARYNLGVELEQRGNTNEALENFRIAASLNPLDADCLNRYGFLLARSGEYEAALNCFEDALRSRPKFTGLNYNIANALFHLTRYEQALPYFHVFLATNPRHAEAHNEFGVALGAMGNLAEAVAEFTSALAIEPENADAHFNLAEALILQEKAAEARKHLLESIRLRPDWKQAKEELGKLNYTHTN